MKNKLIIGISVVALILAGIALYNSVGGDVQLAQATPGSQPIENYTPAIKYNGGIYSELPIQTTSTLTAADITSSGAATFESTASFTGDVTFNGGIGGVTVTTSNTATSSIIVGCLQMYATSTASPGKMTFTSASTTGATGASFIPSWTFGTCP